jgi:hypothetical protein
MTYQRNETPEPVASAEPSDWSFAGWFRNTGKPDEPHWEQVVAEHANDPDVLALGFWAHHPDVPFVEHESQTVSDNGSRGSSVSD